MTRRYIYKRLEQIKQTLDPKDAEILEMALDLMKCDARRIHSFEVNWK